MPIKLIHFLYLIGKYQLEWKTGKQWFDYGTTVYLCKTVDISLKMVYNLMVSDNNVELIKNEAIFQTPTRSKENEKIIPKAFV